MRTVLVLIPPLLLFTLAGCGERAATPAAAQRAAGAPAEGAEEYVARLNEELAALDKERSAAEYTMETFINADTQYLNARTNERFLERLGRGLDEARRYEAQKLAPETARELTQLQFKVAAPAPKDPAKRARMAQLQAEMVALYGEGKSCPKGPASCKNYDQLADVLATSRNYEELTAAWTGWHDVGRTLRADYTEFVALANEGAREAGYKDLGVLWRSRYDMTPDEFDATAERLWQQVKPLYDGLQCYARRRLAARYGEDKVPAGKPIPAQLFGNMWAQQWNRIYPDLLMPYPKSPVESADAQLKAQKWDPVRMARSAESFYTSLGFPKLPPTFWARSLLARPRDREVVCYASAWDMNPGTDVRVKACLEPTEEDLYTIYHELGHDYYFLAYAKQPYPFREGANDGFHEAIGDTVNLSVTPAYLAKLGLIRSAQPGHDALINQQMKMATQKIAFLPFGRVIDLWRWKVFSGEITPENYNSSWWELRRRYQGIAPPVARSEADFDPGAKFHVPGNTPYTRYFLSFILQFQFHKALCQAAGFRGPLYECSVFGSEAAGEKFQAMLSQGSSRPWQDTLARLTGTRDIDAAAIGEYFQPLLQWLGAQNQGQQCGW